MSLIAAAIPKVIGGLGAAIKGKGAQKAQASQNLRMAQALGNVGYSTFGPGSQMAQLRDQQFAATQRTPEQMAQEQSAYARGQWADAMNLATQRGQQNMVSRGFENMNDAQTGLQKAVLSRMLAPGASMFTDQMSRDLASARQYQDALRGQEYTRGYGQLQDQQGLLGAGGAAGSAAQTMVPQALGMMGSFATDQMLADRGRSDYLRSAENQAALQALGQIYSRGLQGG